MFAFNFSNIYMSFTTYGLKLGISIKAKIFVYVDKISFFLSIALKAISALNS